MKPDVRATLAGLGVRNALRTDRYFVGRERELARLSACVSGESRQCAWIYGPRRTGKSSLARKLQRDAESEGALTLWCDMSDATDLSFDVMLQYALAEAERILRVNFSEETTSARFESFVTSQRTRPVLIVFDELDRIAPSLALEQQGFLRKRSELLPLLSYVFVTRQDPAYLVEEVSDVLSRLLGVCLLEVTQPLKARGVEMLVRRAFEDLSVALDPIPVRDAIWQRVGGFPLGCTALVHALASAVVSGTLENANAEDIEDVLDDERSRLHETLLHYWWELQPRTRLALLGQSDPLKGSALQISANDDGLWHRGLIRPDWLMRVALAEGANPPAPGLGAANEPLQRIERLHSLISSVNEALKLYRFHDAFHVTNESLKWHYLLRPVEDDRAFADAIDYLYKLFYESVGSGGGGNERKVRLPPPVDATYRNSDVVADLSALRNHYRHDKNGPDDDRSVNRSYRDVGDIFRKYLGSPTCDSAMGYQRVLASLMDAACDVVDQLNQQIRTGACRVT